MVLLRVDDLPELSFWSEELYRDRELYTMFHEPDNGVGWSALACLPRDGRIFSGLHLL